MRELLRLYAVELAAVIGALLGLRYVENLSRVSAAFSLASGLACAYYGTSLVVYFMNPPEKIAASVLGLTGFILGFTGFFILAGVMTLLRKSTDAATDSIPGVIKRWIEKFGGKDGPS